MKSPSFFPEAHLRADQVLPDLAIRLVCPECKRSPPNIIEEFASGDLVCGDCGLVLGDRIIDTRREWRNFEDTGVDKSRVGNEFDPGEDDRPDLATEISGARGTIDPTTLSLQRANQAIESNRSQAVKTRRRLLEGCCDAMHLPSSITLTAGQILKRYDTSNEYVTANSKVKAMVWACIFLACRLQHVPRTWEEVAKVSGLSKRVLSRAYNTIKDLRVPKTGTDQRASDQVSFVDVKASTVEQHMPKYCNMLGLPHHIERCCEELVRACKARDVQTGRHPGSIAGGVILFVTQKYGCEKPIGVICEVVGKREKPILEIREAIEEAGAVNWPELRLSHLS